MSQGKPDFKDFIQNIEVPVNAGELYKPFENEGCLNPAIFKVVERYWKLVKSSIDLERFASVLVDEGLLVAKQNTDFIVNASTISEAFPEKWFELSPEFFPQLSGLNQIESYNLFKDVRLPYGFQDVLSNMTKRDQLKRQFKLALRDVLKAEAILQ